MHVDLANCKISKSLVPWLWKLIAFATAIDRPAMVSQLLVQSQIHFAKCLKLREVCYQILLNCYIKKAMQLNVELILPNPALTSLYPRREKHLERVGIEPPSTITPKVDALSPLELGQARD